MLHSCFFSPKIRIRFEVLYIFWRFQLSNGLVWSVHCAHVSKEKTPLYRIDFIQFGKKTFECSWNLLRNYQKYIISRSVILEHTHSLNKIVIHSLNFRRVSMIEMQIVLFEIGRKYRRRYLRNYHDQELRILLKIFIDANSEIVLSVR